MEYQGKRNIYGYKFIGTSEKYFEVDEETVRIVRKIFQMSLEKNSLENVIDFLNINNCKTPAEYIEFNNQIFSNQNMKGMDYLWDVRMVRRILRNRLYTGELEWNRRESYYEEGERKQRVVHKTKL